MAASPNLIADAAVTAIRALALVPDANVVRRKTPSLPHGLNPPAIVVVVGEGGEEGETDYLTAAHKLNRYPTTVIIVTAAGGSLTGDDATVREWRVAIEEELADKGRTAFATVPGFILSKAVGKPPFDGSVLGRDLNYSAQTFGVQVVEPFGS